MAHLRPKPPLIAVLLALLACLTLAACGGNTAASPTATPASATPTSPPAASTPASATATSGTAGTTPLTTDPAVIREHGYTPSPHYVQSPDGFGHTLYAWHGTCAGSADGYCQMMFFFIDARFLRTDTRDPSMAIANYRAAGTGTIAVTYASYGPQDPLCCPSGKPVTITYHWNGSRLIPSGTPPRH